MTEIKEQNRFLPPMRMHPAYRHGDMTPWGGEQLKTVFGKDIPDERTGEALEMSVIPGLESTDDDGVTLTALIERYGSRLTGLPEGTEFPLLLKLLAAKGTLSVQVHPDDEYAKAHENKLGKTEAWVILHAEEDASLLYGIREGVTIDDLRRALTGGEDVEPLIQLLYEIQQSSDVTYRLWDFNRVNAKGEKRPLHIQQSLDVIRPELKGLRAHMPEHPAQEITRLLDVPAFTLDCVAADGACILPAAETFRVLTALEPLTLRWLEGEMELKAGDTVLLPAACPEVGLEGHGRALVSGVGRNA